MVPHPWTCPKEPHHWEKIWNRWYFRAFAALQLIKISKRCIIAAFGLRWVYERERERHDPRLFFFSNGVAASHNYQSPFWISLMELPLVSFFLWFNPDYLNTPHCTVWLPLFVGPAKKCSNNRNNWVGFLCRRCLWRRRWWRDISVSSAWLQRFSYSEWIAAGPFSPACRDLAKEIGIPSSLLRSSSSTKFQYSGLAWDPKTHD